MDIILQGAPGVMCYTDNMLVSGLATSRSAGTSAQAGERVWSQSEADEV